MRIFILITFLLSCGGGAALGARLVAAGLRTRTAPELAYGGSLLLMGLGGVVRLVVHGILGGGPEYHGWMVAAGVLRVGTLVALTYGIRVIYRPQDGWGAALMLSLWGLSACGLAVVALYPGGFEEAGQLYQLGDVAAALSVTWALVESVAYTRKLRRRLAVGLADPATVQRFAVWSVGFACALGASLALVGGTAWVGGAITNAPAIMAGVQAFLLVTTIATWCAFYPPRFLQERAGAQQPARDAASG